MAFRHHPRGHGERGLVLHAKGLRHCYFRKPLITDAISSADNIFKFFEYVVTKSIRDVMLTRKVNCFMMVCGGLVKFEESRLALTDVMRS